MGELQAQAKKLILPTYSNLTESNQFRDMRLQKKIPTLVELCVQTAIDNVMYLGDVGETDIHLLKDVLPHCTRDQLMHIEKSSEGRDLSPVTDALWKRFYRLEFGENSRNLVIERMKQKKVSFKWRQLYEAKKKDWEEAQKKLAVRLKKLYEKETIKKQSRQIQICTEVPPSSKRSFFGGNGPWSNSSSSKGNLMKKAKMEFRESHEVKVHAIMRRNALQKNQGASRMMQPIGFSGKGSASSSQFIKPFRRS